MSTIADNLFRKELTALEKANQLGRYLKLLKEEGPGLAKQGGQGFNQYKRKGETVSPLQTETEFHLLRSCTNVRKLISGDQVGLKALICRYDTSVFAAY